MSGRVDPITARELSMSAEILLRWCKRLRSTRCEGGDGGDGFPAREAVLDAGGAVVGLGPRGSAERGSGWQLKYVTGHVRKYAPC